MKTIFDPIQIDTEHTKIRPLQATTWQKLAESLLYEGSFHARNWGVKTPDDIRRMYEKAQITWVNKMGNPLVFLNHEETEVLGVTNFMNVEPQNKMIEIGGTWINPKYQRGYVNTETKIALLQYCFETLQLVRVEFRIDAENFTSQRAVERLGFHFDGLLPRRKINANQDVRDYTFYSVTDQSWPQTKKHMLSLLEKAHLPEYESLRAIGLLRREGQSDRAWTELQTALEKFPKSSQLHYLAACICDAERTEKEAVPYYHQAIELGLSDNDLKEAYLGLGSTYRSLGEYEKSKAVFQKGMAAFPDYRPYSVFLALTEFNLRNPDRAIQLLLEELLETTNEVSIKAFDKALRFYSTRLNEVFE
ncbi:MAG: tetratricopeptide repeat protein [Pseudobdellovibrionaceae bacterium]